MAQCICELRERDIPEPYTLNPQPQPKLQNLNTSPKTLNPKPRSLNPTPELNQNLDTGPKPRIVDPQVRGSGPLLRSLSLSLWHKKALSKDCFLPACSRKGSDLETTRDTTTAAAMFYALEFILWDHFYISEPRERGPTHLPPDKGEPRTIVYPEGLPCRILNINDKQELLWSLRVSRHLQESPICPQVPCPRLLSARSLQSAPGTEDVDPWSVRTLSPEPLGP